MHNARQAITVLIKSSPERHYSTLVPLIVRQKAFRRLVSVLVLAAATALSGCVGPYALVGHKGPADSIAWLSPAAVPDRMALDRWRWGVGQPVLPPVTTPAMAGNTLTLVSWNVAVGDADILQCIRQLDRNAPLVLLLQEAYRSGPDVPRELAPLTSYASRLGGRRAGRYDVRSVAASLGLQVYYVPSMRNGGPTVSNEDRGNAILSNLPLGDLTAIELPFERQRRVAIAATVSGESLDGVPWSLRVVSAHLDNMLGLQRLLASGGEAARARQIRGLLSGLNGEAPLALGGDLNSWFGFGDKVYLEAARAFPQTLVTDRRPTFMGLLRLDHLFFRLPPGWRAEFHRGNDRFGSDHYPLIATIRIAA